LSAILLGLLAAGLLAAAITATYGFYVPPVETPIVGALAALFGLILALNLAALGARRLRGRGR
jgi:membrane associated rhomboid family serine protease